VLPSEETPSPFTAAIGTGEEDIGAHEGRKRTPLLIGRKREKPYRSHKALGICCDALKKKKDPQRHTRALWRSTHTLHTKRSN